MNFFQFLLLAVLLFLFNLTKAQLSSLPVTDSWNADTAYARSAASALWSKNQISIQTSGLAHVPELRSIDMRAYKIYSHTAFSISAQHNGTDFLKQSKLSIGAAHRVQYISCGINLHCIQYYAREYYSLYRLQSDVHTMARLLKGKTWFSMHLNNLIPSQHQRLVSDPMQLSLSMSHRVLQDLRVGLQQHWFRKNYIEHSLWLDLRWNRYISSLFSYRLKEKFSTVGLRFFYRNHSWQNTASLFYTSGLLWSCAYSYSW